MHKAYHLWMLADTTSFPKYLYQLGLLFVASRSIPTSITSPNHIICHLLHFIYSSGYAIKSHISNFTFPDGWFFWYIYWFFFDIFFHGVPVQVIFFSHVCKCSIYSNDKSSLPNTYILNTFSHCLPFYSINGDFWWT